MRFLVFKKRTIWFTALIAFTLLALCIPVFNSSSAAGVYFGNSVRKVPIYAVETTEKNVAISFDAAWGADKTKGILEILKDRNAKATFFLVGFWAEEHPDMVKAIVDAGMEIGLHSNSHPDFVKLTEEQMKNELVTNIEILEKITGKKPNLFRFPFGSYNDKAMTVVKSLGLMPIQWDVDSLDWQGNSALDISSRVLGKAKKGSICLFHNNSAHVLDSLPIVLDGLIKKGFNVTNVGSVVYKENFVVDKQGIQKLKK